MTTKKLLHQRNFTLFLLGQNTSVFGDILLTTGFSLFVLLTTQSAMQLSITLAVTFIPKIFLSPYAGVIVDRLPKKPLVILLDTLRSCWLLGLFFISLKSPLDLKVIYVTLGFFALCDTFFMPGIMTLFIRITPKEQLEEGNAHMNTSQNIVSVLSPFLATALFTYKGLSLLLLLDGLTFLVSAFVEWLMVFEDQTSSNNKQSIHKEIVTVTGFVKGHTQLKSLMVNGILTHLFLFPFIEIGVMHLLLITFKAPETHYGFLQSTISIAAIIGGVIALYYGKYRSIATNINYGIFGMLFSVLVFGLLIFNKFRDILLGTSFLPTLYLSVGCFLIFLSFSFYGVFFVSYYQREMPSDYLGRYTGLKVMSFSAARLVGMFIYGYFIEYDYLSLTLITLFIGMFLKVIVHLPFITAEKKLLQGEMATNETTQSSPRRTDNHHVGHYQKT